ncbi:MAG TPA: toll/interleukin-1 receptor domain-containing protein [Thermoanaerobaculia bacterium]|nr:toll/interleukin-1 receptor domain-containing protein [Thermoanaerobaculia bacterium]
MPRVFISYSWDDEDHKRWVRDLAARLRTHGVETLLDQWHLVPGDQLPAFMETAIRESDFVLVICTPGYKVRSDSRAGGVGYEGDIITGEIYCSRNHRKFIPLLARDSWLIAAPSWLQGKYFLDFTKPPALDEVYHDLLRTLLGQRSPAPPLTEPAALGPEVSLRALFGNQRSYFYQ